MLPVAVAPLPLKSYFEGLGGLVRVVYEVAQEAEI